MLSYRNMLLVSVEDYQNLRKQILYNQAPELMQDLYKVRETTDKLPPDQQIALEGEVLRQHIKQNEVTPPQQLQVTPTQMDDSVIVNNLNSFNKINKVRANQIYQHLKAYKIQWNEMGQLLDSIDNTPIPNSNIVELIDYITNARRNARLPAGFNEFLSLVEKSQLPRHYLSVLGITRIEDYKHLQSASDPQDIEPTSSAEKIGKWKRLKRLQH